MLTFLWFYVELILIYYSVCFSFEIESRKMSPKSRNRSLLLGFYFLWLEPKRLNCCLPTLYRWFAGVFYVCWFFFLIYNLVNVRFKFSLTFTLSLPKPKVIWVPNCQDPDSYALKVILYLLPTSPLYLNFHLDTAKSITWKIASKNT